MSEIDVGKCEFLNEESCLCQGYCEYDGLHIHLYCEDNHNCYYKQLQKLKQENEELRNLLNYYFEDNSSNYDNFCDICNANGKCNGNCCYEQLKEVFEYGR